MSLIDIRISIFYFTFQILYFWHSNFNVINIVNELCKSMYWFFCCFFIFYFLFFDFVYIIINIMYLLKNREVFLSFQGKRREENRRKKNWRAFGVYLNEQIIYSSLNPNGSMKLYEFIAIVTGVMIILSQLPTFHSLRHVNLGSLLLSLGYAFLVVVACIIAGIHLNF